MDLKKKPYKIEVWEDKWIEASLDSPAAIKKQGGYWEEIRSVRIGDSNIKSFGSAFDPLLKREVSGEITLEFSIYGYYYEEGEKVRNFLVPFLFNEAKIKLQYDGDWYDFIVKEMTESHESKGLIYRVRCEYLPMVELSKNGWNLSFSLEQENCIGTIDYFANIILDGTDWKYKEDANCNLTEYNLEYLYGINVPEGTILKGIKDCCNREVSNITLNEDTIVYTFFSDTQSKNPTKQVLYIPEGLNNVKKENSYTLSKGLPNYKVDLNINSSELLSTSVYGYRIIENNKTVWEPELSQYVNIYKLGSQIYYSYETTKIEVNYDKLEDTDNPDLTAVATTITKFYKKDDNGEIYKLEVLGGFGKPKNEVNNIKKQIYIDTESLNDNNELDKKMNVYVYNGSIWVKDDSLNAEDYVIGKKTIVYYTKEELNGIQIEILPRAEKQRSLIEEKSNRFNLLQKLAELFEVWTFFEIEHDESGRVVFDENGCPNKFVTFKSEFGKDNYAGFSYDLNVSSIKRTINSTSLATKMYVEKIDNENSKDGICSIQSADYNIAGELFLINLDYYAQIGLIDGNKLLKDLYGTTSTDFGYLTKLGKLNKQYTNLTEEIDGENGLSIQLAEFKEMSVFYKDAIDTAMLEKKLLEKDNNNNALTASEKENFDSLIEELKNKINNYIEEFEILEKKIISLEKTIKNRELSLEEIVEGKDKLNEQFYKMYSRFILEGTWQGTDYIEPNAYYYDANQVLLESSRPSIEYDISVYDISQANDFLNNDTYSLYQYDLGDITYIEDIEFFGKDEFGTPYKEQVIISSIENNLDSPEHDKISIKNYKTRFEDLFQRTTATVQSYNLNKNVYERAAVIEATGEINYNSLQNTLANNNFILSQSKTNSVIIDNNGVEVLNLDNYRERVRIVSGGIFVSNDGGTSWNSGITGEGINTAMLLAGRIDAEKINILNGSYPTFAWDKYGINAFSWQESPDSEYENKNKFIRFDQYGLYGISSNIFNDEKIFNPIKQYDENGNIINENLKTTKEVINNIKSHSLFSLTWDGFNLKTNSGAIEIDSQEDIRVLEGTVERVKLGQLGQDLYGLRLSDKKGNPTLITGSDGNLILTGIMFIGDQANLITNTAAVAIGNLGKEELVDGYKDKNRRILIQKEGNNIDRIPEPTFVVYDTGDVYIAGGISADFGNIGGFTIEDDKLSSKTVSLSPNGIEVFKEIKNIDDTTGEELSTSYQTVFIADADGNLVFNDGLARNLQVENGNFNNINITANGEFSGTINANNGLINGSLILGLKVISFELTSAEKYINNSENKEDWYLEDLIILGTLDKENSYLDNIIENKYYFIQTQYNNSEQIFVIQILQKTTDNIYFKIISNNIELNENLFNSLINKKYYQVSSNNIVLDGQSGNIYTFDYILGEEKGYQFNGNGSINARDLFLGNNTSFVKANDEGIAISINGENSFSVNEAGQLKTNSIIISGTENNYIQGNIYIGNSNEGISLKAKGEISDFNYSNSGGAAGWAIKQDGSAIFNDVTIRGRIQSSTFVQNEIQALSGMLVVRPTLTFKDNSIITFEENNYVGFVNELLVNEHGEIDNNLWENNYYRIEYKNQKYNFIIVNYDLFDFKEENENTTRVGKITLKLLGNNEKIDEDILKEFISLPLINIGNKLNTNTIGICINATKINTDFGFPESLTIYDQNIQDYVDSENNNQFIFGRNNRLIMGRLPDDSSIDIPDNLRGSFGFYADNVYLKGAMISASGEKYSLENPYMTSGISTKEENGNIFWAGASGDTSNDISNAPFRVTRDGYLYAEKGIFKGTVEAAIIKTAKIEGSISDGLLQIVSNPSSNSSISFEYYDGEKYITSAKLGNNNFTIAAPFNIYNNGNIDSNEVPSLMNFSNNINNIGINKLTIYNPCVENENYLVKGWGIENNHIFYRQIINNTEVNINSYKDRIEDFIETDTSNIFEIEANNDNISLNYNKNNQIIIKEDNVSIYNNLILSNQQNNQNNEIEIINEEQEKNIKCSFKVTTKLENEKEIVTGYNLFIEEY